LNDALPLAEPGILAAWRRGRPSIVTVRSFTPLDSVHRRLSRLLAAGVFTSEVLREDQHRQGARFRREEIIPNAIDPAPYAQPPDPAGVRAEFHLPDQARIAIVAGRLMRRKGLDVFIQALAHLQPAHPDLYGLIVGEVDPQEAGLKEELLGLAEGLGIAGQIRFAGYRDDVPRLLQASDLLCFVPTAPEPFGRTLIEGMAAGLPVIGGTNGGIPDIVREGETGLLVPPSDPIAQAGAMQRLLSQPALAQALGQAGRCHAADRYSIAGQVDQLTALYESILVDSPRR
jgi:glycosyltransferase involved in cell wall biosynthesis